MAVAVICEFNPFHNGHKYLLDTAKSLTGEPVIAVMSGSFTQRGEVAVCSKFERTKAALQGGADLVLELPAVYAVANAQRFARAGVELASSFDCASRLAFGCETDDISLLQNACDAYNNAEVKAHLKAEMKKGGYYPKAFENAVRKTLGDSVADVLTSPNNVLAVEYLRSLDKRLKPLPVKRVGASHDSQKPLGDIGSASFIRKLLLNGQNAEKYLPCAPQSVANPERLEMPTLYRLRGMNAEDFAALPDVGEGLENRIAAAAGNYNSTEEIIEGIKTKRYTRARIRRILACALLGITEELQSTPIEYVRALGFTESGARLLKHCRKPVVTSAADGLRLGGNIQKLLKKDIFASDIFALCHTPPLCAGLDFTTPIVKA